VQWQNWSGLESAEPREVLSPASSEAVVAAVVAARQARTTVKMVGTLLHRDCGAGDTMLRPDRLSGIARSIARR
jgi:L-gulonolactone oxidase